VGTLEIITAGISALIPAVAPIVDIAGLALAISPVRSRSMEKIIQELKLPVTPQSRSKG